MSPSLLFLLLDKGLLPENAVMFQFIIKIFSGILTMKVTVFTEIITDCIVLIFDMITAYRNI